MPSDEINHGIYYYYNHIFSKKRMKIADFLFPQRKVPLKVIPGIYKSNSVLTETVLKS
jgi:hypothetical protein